MTNRLRNQLSLLLSLLFLASPTWARKKAVPMEGDNPTSLMTLTLSTEGGIPKELEPSFEVLAWSWGMSYDVEAGEVKRGKTLPGGFIAQEISLTKYLGANSPQLAKLMADHTAVKKVTLTVDNANQKLTMILKNAFVTSVSMGGSSGEDNMTENVNLHFDNVEYQLTEKKGSAANKMSSASIDCRERK